MMSLAWKHENLYVESSARTRKHWPKAFVGLARSHGNKRVIFATDYPLLPFQRHLAELEAMAIPEEVFLAIVRETPSTHSTRGGGVTWSDLLSGILFLAPLGMEIIKDGETAFVGSFDCPLRPRKALAS